MELNEYQRLAQRTSNNTCLRYEKLNNGILGMAGEAGECVDLLKKHLYQEHELDREKLLDEVGDVLWYVAETAAGLGKTLEEVAQHNIDKLKARYPDGFDPQRSIHRPEYEAEREEETRESTSVFLFNARNKPI